MDKYLAVGMQQEAPLPGPLLAAGEEREKNLRVPTTHLLVTVTRRAQSSPSPFLKKGLGRGSRQPPAPGLVHAGSCLLTNGARLLTRATHFLDFHKNHSPPVTTWRERRSNRAEPPEKRRLNTKK